MSFSEDIKRIRRKAFMTQEDFAKEIGVSFATVNRWETGKAKPNLKTMKLIDEYCKKNSIDFLPCGVIKTKIYVDVLVVRQQKSSEAHKASELIVVF